MNRQQYCLSKLLCRTLKSAAALAALTVGLLVASSFGQNPVPQIVGPVHPMAVAPGGGDFTLSVYGANFVPGAVVNWNYQSRTTTYNSGHELQAQILSTDIAKNTAGYITVTNPAPGGGSSSASWAQVEVHEPISTITVSPFTYYPFGFWAVSAADFNHDAILDLVGEYYGLALEGGKGDGTFHPWSMPGPKYLSTSPFVYGDFNGDGNLDLAFDEGDQNSTSVQHVGVVLGDGKGGFRAGPTLTATGGALGQVVIGDFNRDGKLDLMTSGQGFMAEFLGNGDGSFVRNAYYRYTSITNKMLVGDFNGDGILDLVIFGPQSNGTLALFFMQGNGNGSFKRVREVASLAGTRECSSLAQLGDFNGDGKLDVAFCNKSQIGVLLGNGDGTFQPPVYYTADPTEQGLFTFAFGDINSDGIPDLLVSEYPISGPTPFVVFLGNGDGTFQAPQTISSIITFGELGIVTGDFNSDGLLDFIFQTGGGMDVFIQQ